MRIVHTSDWHLGHQLHGVAREREHAAFLAWLVEACDEEAADAVVITGDVFDGSNPPAAAQAAYYGFLAALAARLPGVHVIVIGGNHDSPARLEAPAPLLERLNVRVVGALPRAAHDPARIDWDRAIVAVGPRGGAPAATVLAVPFLRLGDLGGRDDGEPGDAVRAIYAEGAAAARARGLPLVVTGHLHVGGAEPSALSERRIVIGGAEAVAADLFPSDAAYVALGHLHKAQRVGGRDHVRYAGSPIPLAMSEADYRHQVVIVDVEPGQVRVRAREVPRLIELVRVPRRGAAPLAEVVAALGALPPLDPEDDRDLRPFLEVHVALTEPAPQLRALIEQAMDGRRPRLVKIAVERAGSGAALGDAAPGVALADLSPREVVIRKWHKEHDGEPPAALLAALDALVQAVQEGQ